ncbi:TPA: hypothetical protein ACX6QN_003819 [Photobacterium damselae]|uniref:hypothetical protein n=1 Tax=Photobacterium damselae TaxID=38293 RepID=UPI003B67326E
MELKLHSNASTTPRTRKYIKNSPKSDNELAYELGISIDTVKKWRNRDCFVDKSHRPNHIHRRLTPEQEWLIIYLRIRLFLSLDELLEASKLLINRDLSRAVLNRCLKKYQMPRVSKPAKTDLGSVVIDMILLPPNLSKSTQIYLLVLSDLYSSYINFALLDTNQEDAIDKLKIFIDKSLPYKVKKMFATKNDYLQLLFSKLDIPVQWDHASYLFDFHTDESCDFNQDTTSILAGEYFDKRLGLPSILLCYEDILNKRIIRNRLKNLTPSGYFKCNV